MKNTRAEKENTRKKIEVLPIWKLTIFLSNIEKKIISRKLQGDSSRALRKWVGLRTLYREVLLNKLQEWDKDKSLGNYSYSDLQGIDLEDEFMGMITE